MALLQHDRMTSTVRSTGKIATSRAGARRTAGKRNVAAMADAADGWPNGLSQVTILNQREEGEVLLIEVVSRRTTAVCPRCTATTSTIHERRLQQKQDLGANGKRVVLLLNRRRFRCRQCDKVFTEPDDVCGWRRRTTARFRRYLREQAGEQSMKRIARREGVSRDTVRRALAEAD